MAAPPSGKTILVVEDDRFLSAMYADKLLLSGFQVVTAFDGEEGLTAAREHQPQAILLDILLPKLDGFEVLRRLRAEPQFKAVPVIVLTNLSQPEQVKRGLELGASDYLIKAHFVPAEVVAKLRVLLGDTTSAAS